MWTIFGFNKAAPNTTFGELIISRRRPVMWGYRQWTWHKANETISFTKET